MKVQIEIKEKFVDLASSMLLAETELERAEEQIKEATARVKASDGPCLINLDDVKESEMKQAYLAFALLAISQELYKND